MADFLAELAALDDSRIEAVEVPEWGRTVHVRLMTIAQREAFELWLTDETNRGRWYAGLVAFAACTEDGKPLFADPPAAVPVLLTKAAPAVQRLARVAMRLNRLSDEDAEVAAKN